MESRLKHDCRIILYAINKNERAFIYIFIFCDNDLL